MNDQKIRIFNIQKFSLNDGPGIRTTVFFKSCMLNCLWCHNPESKEFKKQLLLDFEKCVGCGECARACTRHHFNPEHTIDRDNCSACGKCIDVCAGALELIGYDMSVSEIMSEVMRDKLFYDNSNGGITLSGGDPLAQPDGALALLKEAKECGLHTCVETCGYAQWKKVEAVSEFTDLFLWDFKESDNTLHKQYTGVSNMLILENLKRLNELGAEIVLRCPIIPSKNDRAEHFKAIANLAEAYSSIKRVEILPYHPLGQAKNNRLGQKDPLEGISFPEDNAVMLWLSEISKHTSKPVKKA